LLIMIGKISDGSSPLNAPLFKMLLYSPEVGTLRPNRSVWPPIALTL